MPEPKAVGTVRTNAHRDSLAKVAHAPPTVSLLGRIAGRFLGRATYPDPSLHFTVMISDPYTGLFGMDGQPTDDVHPNWRKPRQAMSNFKRIRVQFYTDEVPTRVKLVVPIEPPPGMSGHVFAQSLVRKAYDFVSYSLPYSLPKQLIRDVMVEGHYNSSSFAAGLLKSVMGHVPIIKTPGYQTPGWDQPIPASYFKGEALR